MRETPGLEYHDVVTEKYQKNLLDFAEDETSHEFQEFKKEVESKNGRIRIMIHPFYDDSRNADKVDKGLMRLIQADESKSLPIIIFEAKSSMERTKEYLSESTKSAKHHIYYVPTYIHSPTPDIRTDKLESGKQNDARWDKVVEILKTLGVKEVIVGGLLLGIIPEPSKSNLMSDEYTKQRLDKGAKNVDYSLEFCVGRAIAEFAKRDLDVELSGIVGGTYGGTKANLLKTERMRSLNYPEEEGEE